MPSARRVLLCAALLLVAVPAPGHAQVFLASKPHPDFTIGPLFVVANIRPELTPVSVTISWSLTPAPGRRAADIAQDLYLLWPGELGEGTAPGPADPELIRHVEALGFAVTASGRLVLRTRDRMQMGTGLPAPALPEVASFVTFVRRIGLPTAQAYAGTYIKIPWTPSLADPQAVTVLTLTTRGMITPKPATWFEETFWGRRWVLTAGFGDIGSLVMPLFPLYFEHRDRVVRLAREFSLVVANFADAEHLRIEAIEPGLATRRPSRLRAGFEVVSMPLAPGEGIAPQQLKVQFSYFTGMIAWRPIVVSVLLLALGNIAGFILLSRDVSQFFRARLAVRRKGEPAFARTSGGDLPRELADQIVPGRTSESDLLALCGRPDEEHRGTPGSRRILVYRGVRRLPRTRRALGPLSTIDRWDEERHELEIELDGDRVSAVQSRMRRERVTG